MPWISKELYKRIPLKDRLKVMSYEKLLSVAEKYGINTFNLYERYGIENKADLINEILEIDSRLNK